MQQRLSGGTSRRGFVTLVAGAMVISASLSVAQQAQPGQQEGPLSKLREAELRDLVLNSPPGTMLHVDVVFRTQPDLASMATTVAHLPHLEKARALAAAAKALAADEQEPVLQYLAPLEAEGRAKHVAALWMGNIIGVETTADVILELASFDDVAYVHYDPPRNALLANPGGGPVNPACGVDRVGAEFAWNHMNNRGEGITVAVIDTGTCYNHPDIRNQIWINPGENLDGDNQLMDTDDMNGVDDDGNGYIDDLIGWSFDHNAPGNNPDDFHSHGSHTAGTVGGDGTQGRECGVAPGCNVMPVRNSADISFEIEVWQGMEYAAINAADIISMSLGWLHQWNPDRPMWRTLCNNTQAMGTMMVIAAGNESNCCPPIDNVRTPGDVPEITSVGATDCSDNLAWFSSLGPVEWNLAAPYNDFPYPPGLRKPNVSAPGDIITSHSFCNGYVDFSGTSMATPNVAGISALLMKVRPDLDHAGVRAALESTSIDLGAVGPDNSFGAGRVSVENLLNTYAPFAGDNYDLSAATGGTVNLRLRAGASRAGQSYWILGSFTGNDPGLNFPSGAHVPINWDSLTLLTLSAANSPSFQNWRSTLDGAGNSTAVLDTGGPFDPVAVGACLSFAYLTPIISPSYGSNPVNILIVP